MKKNGIHATGETYAENRQYAAGRRHQKIWKGVLIALACVVIVGVFNVLTLPALTMNQQHCQLEEHQHTDACFGKGEIMTCTLEKLGVHQHTDECFDAKGNAVCHYADFVIHEHDSACYDANEKLICPLQEIKPHQHEKACYASGKDNAVDPDAKQLICKKEEVVAHTHKKSCFNEDGNIVCGLREIVAHQHGKRCTSAKEAVLLCGLQEHQHTEACSSADAPAADLKESDSSVVVEALVVLKGEDGKQNAPRRVAAKTLAVDAQTPGMIKDYLKEAEILVNGQQYDGTSELNPGEQFQIELKWELEREQLLKTLTYTYQIPEQIVVEDVEQAVLYDENNNRKGVYSIKNGVLTVTYDNVADVNTTTFKLNATWDQKKIGKETTVNWNDKLTTPVKFDNSQISVTKELLEQKDMPDGSVIGEYAVTVTAKSVVNGINLTDTLIADKFHFAEGYYEVDGQKYDYRIKQADSSYTYGNFEKTTNDDGSVTLTFPSFNLPENGTYKVEYGVKLDADDRFALDQYQTPTGLRNTATASYQSGEDTISSTVTVENTYRAEDKWLVKTQGDAVADNEAPWTIKVNNAKAYDMGGAVIGDKIETEGVTYKQDKGMTITGTTKEGEKTTYKPTWVTISDATAAAIAASPNAFDRLFDPNDAEGLATKQELEAAARVELTKENIFDYVFVGKSNNQFVWISPQNGTPTSYEISYYTDTSDAGNAITNSASAGWKQWTVGDVVGGLKQEVKIKKENSGVRQDGEDYFVDWTITLTVPPNSGAIKDVYFYDSMPWHNETYDFDHLVGLSSNQIDFSKGEITGDRVAQIKDLDYLKGLTKNAFSVKSDNAAVQQYLDKHSYTTLGHPIIGLVYNWPGAGKNFDVFDGSSEVGHLEIIDADGSWFAGKRMTPAAFGIYLGDLPATGDKAYNLTVKYTTKVDPVWVDQLDGLGQGVNAVQLKQKVNDNLEVTLAEAYSKYWITHTKAQDTLDKNVVDFDPEKKILTYRVEIDPLANLVATPGATYQLKDVLNLPGATYVKDSFVLSFHGSVDPDPNSNAFTWDSSKNAVLWRSDKSMKETDYGVSPTQALFFHSNSTDAGSIKMDIANKTNDSSEYTLSIPNPHNVLGLSAPESNKGMLAPMSLTYQVKLPENAEEIGTGTLINNVSLYRQEGAKNPELLDGAKAEFDYSSALHKKLTVTPDNGNGYTAKFTIDVDKTVNEWPEDLTDFTVQDDMSKSLTPDITSIKVYGCGKNGQNTLLTGGFTVSYDDQSADENTLSITISDQSYQRYQIIYDAKLASGEANKTVALSNTASVVGTQIKSEDVKKDVYIQKQNASVVETKYQVKLLKFDAANTSTKLVATFTLYAYENGNWVSKKTGIKTGTDGMITLENSNSKTILNKNTLYKLVETDPPEGYIASTTYFRIGQKPENETADVSEDMVNTIPLKGGMHQIPNYKATLTLQKVDAENTTKLLSGAEFKLYSNAECTTEAGTLKETQTGIYSLPLEKLKAGTTYYLKETKAPAGYKLPGTVYQAQFNDKGEVTLKVEKDGKSESVTKVDNAYQIPNEIGYELPETGGIGTLPYLLGGLMLMGAATLIAINRRYKNRKGAR